MSEENKNDGGIDVAFGNNKLSVRSVTGIIAFLCSLLVGMCVYVWEIHMRENGKIHAEIVQNQKEEQRLLSRLVSAIELIATQMKRQGERRYDP